MNHTKKEQQRMTEICKGFNDAIEVMPDKLTVAELFVFLYGLINDVYKFSPESKQRLLLALLDKDENKGVFH